MESGQRRVESGEWRVESGETAVREILSGWSGTVHIVLTAGWLAGWLAGRDKDEMLMMLMLMMMMIWKWDWGGQSLFAPFFPLPSLRSLLISGELSGSLGGWGGAGGYEYSAREG